MRRATIEGENRIVVMVRDISERKRAEEQLRSRRSWRNLTGPLKEGSMRRLQSCVKDELLLQQSRHAAMGEMLNNIAHQWRQPLNNIAIYVQSMQLLKASGELTDEQIQSDVQNIMAIINYMSKTIDDFRSFFRQEKQKQVFYLKEASEKAVSLVSARWSIWGLSFSWLLGKNQLFWAISLNTFRCC